MVTSSWLLFLVTFGFLQCQISALAWVNTISGDGINEPLVMDIFRAVSTTSAYTKKLMNCDAANAGGVLGYLHTEVIPSDMSPNCMRKFNINSIAVHQVTILNPPGQQPFGEYLAFDSGKCTVPNCTEIFKERGYYVGSQSQSGNPRHSYKNAFWYSFPQHGICDKPNGTKNCTYSYKFKFLLDLNDLSSIPNYHDWCMNGGIEFERKGRINPDCCLTVHSVPFWKEPCNVELCNDRIQLLLDLYGAQGTKQCDFHFDTNYAGNEIKNIPDVIDAAMCCYYCSREPECKYWSWNGPDGDLQCSLKTSNDAHSQLGVISGSSKSSLPPTPAPAPPTPAPPTPTPAPPTPASPTKNCSMEPDTNYWGFDIGTPGVVESADVCCNFCNKVEECKYWTWNGPGAALDKTCYLKTSNKSSFKQEGFTSGSAQNTPPSTSFMVST